MDVILAAADDHRKPRGSVDVMYISLQDEVPTQKNPRSITRAPKNSHKLINQTFGHKNTLLSYIATTASSFAFSSSSSSSTLQSFHPSPLTQLIPFRHVPSFTALASRS